MENIILLVEKMLMVSPEIADWRYVIQTGRIIPFGRTKELLESDNVRKTYMDL